MFSNESTIYPDKEYYISIIREIREIYYFGKADADPTGLLTKITVDEEKYDGEIEIRFLMGYARCAFSLYVKDSVIKGFVFDAESLKTYFS